MSKIFRMKTKLELIRCVREKSVFVTHFFQRMKKAWMEEHVEIIEQEFRCCARRTEQVRIERRRWRWWKKSAKLCKTWCWFRVIFFLFVFFFLPINVVLFQMEAVWNFDWTLTVLHSMNYCLSPTFMFQKIECSCIWACECVCFRSRKYMRSLWLCRTRQILDSAFFFQQHIRCCLILAANKNCFDARSKNSPPLRRHFTSCRSTYTCDNQQPSAQRAQDRANEKKICAW